MSSPSNFQCPEYIRILRELQRAGQTDFRDRKNNWLASGRSLEELRDQCLAAMAHDDSSELLSDPRTAEARSKIAEHEALTGHSVFTSGLRIALYGPNY